MDGIPSFSSLTQLGLVPKTPQKPPPFHPSTAMFDEFFFRRWRWCMKLVVICVKKKRKKWSVQPSYCYLTWRPRIEGVFPVWVVWYKKSRWTNYSNPYTPKNYQEWTWNLKMMVSNRNLLFQGSIFRFHVCFGGCTYIHNPHPPEFQCYWCPLSMAANGRNKWNPWRLTWRRKTVTLKFRGAGGTYSWRIWGLINLSIYCRNAWKCTEMKGWWWKAEGILKWVDWFEAMEVKQKWFRDIKCRRFYWFGVSFMKSWIFNGWNPKGSMELSWTPFWGGNQPVGFQGWTFLFFDVMKVHEDLWSCGFC